MLPNHIGRRVRRSSSSSSSSRRMLSTVPRLPVPDLRKTLDRYLKSLEPLLVEDAARGGQPFQAAYDARAKWAQKFETGVGRLCQERLLALDKSSPCNWLEDNFWMKKAYHEWRAPLLINSNWWLAFHNDSTIPPEVLLGRSSSPKMAGITPWQIRRAAWLVHRTLEFKERMKSSQHDDSETTRTGIWLRETTARMFNVGRIPHEHCDTLSAVPAASHPNCRKLFVMIHDWCYAVDVYDDSLKLLDVGTVEKRIEAVVGDVSARLKNGERAVPIGVLTADRRDVWAKNLQHLNALSGQNRDNHNIILDSLMCLSLDHYTNVVRPPSRSSDIDEVPPLNSQLELDAHLHNVRSGRNARNRWFDKAFTVMVESNTRAGAMGEHSPCDALVPSIVTEYALVENLEMDAFERPPASQGHHLPGGWKRLDWVVDERIERECLAAEERAKAIIDDSDDSVLWFTGYGTDWIKQVAKFSPDAFVQMILQLSWYQTRGEFTATYETALTRMFQHGRTETIRTLTSDSRAFVLAMINPSQSSVVKYRALQRAIQTHVSLTREAATGRGIDRHLLGLRLMLRPDQGERADLFEDELFQRSQEWKLSTSGLSAGHYFRGTGFGAAYQDGYGINYLAAPDIIKFGIESKFSSSLTSTEKFKDTIRSALLSIKTMVENAVAGSSRM